MVLSVPISKNFKFLFTFLKRSFEVLVVGVGVGVEVWVLGFSLMVPTSKNFIFESFWFDWELNT